MNEVTLATSVEDAEAVEAMKQEHAELAGALAAHVDAVVVAVSGREGDEIAARRAALLDWSRHELVPHVVAEEQVLYPAAAGRPEARLLVDSILREHRAMVGLLDEIGPSVRSALVLGPAYALKILFGLHVAKLDEQLATVLAGAPDISLVGLLGELHDTRAKADAYEKPDSGPSDPSCTCGETDGIDYPELDARAVPHAIRHATVFGALDAVAPSAGLVLVAPHDPIPLLRQLEKRDPGAFSVDYLERGPDAWRLLIVRAGESA